MWLSKEESKQKEREELCLQNPVGIMVLGPCCLRDCASWFVGPGRSDLIFFPATWKVSRAKLGIKTALRAQQLCHLAPAWSVFQPLEAGDAVIGPCLAELLGVDSCLGWWASVLGWDVGRRCGMHSPVYGRYKGQGVGREKGALLLDRDHRLPLTYKCEGGICWKVRCALGMLWNYLSLQMMLWFECSCPPEFMQEFV
jgi:hypothetical protein